MHHGDVICLPRSLYVSHLFCDVISDKLVRVLSVLCAAICWSHHISI